MHLAGRYMKRRSVISIFICIAALLYGCAGCSLGNLNASLTQNHVTENASLTIYLEDSVSLGNSYNNVEADSGGVNEPEAELRIDVVSTSFETSDDVIKKQYCDFVRQIKTDYLFEAYIADLDGDGKPELIVIYEVPGGKPEYGNYSDIIE